MKNKEYDKEQEKASKTVRPIAEGMTNKTSCEIDLADEAVHNRLLGRFLACLNLLRPCCLCSIYRKLAEVINYFVSFRI